MTTDPRPLSPEDLDALRRSWANTGAGATCSITYGLRLLATLDACKEWGDTNSELADHYKRLADAARSTPPPDLREALAEALCLHRPPEVPEGLDHMVCNECQTIVRRVLSDPAVIAALDRSGPCAGCGNALHYAADHSDGDCDRCNCSRFVPWPDRSGPAEGLREEHEWREAIVSHLGPQRMSLYMGRDIDMMARGAFIAERLATPTASPTEPGRPPLDPATKAHDDAYMAGLIRGRELEREAASPTAGGLDVALLDRIDGLPRITDDDGGEYIPWSDVRSLVVFGVLQSEATVTGERDA